MRTSRTVLLVEDDVKARQAVSDVLGRRGYEVVATGDGIEGERLLSRGLPGLLLVNMLLPGRSGFHLARLAKEQSDGRVPVIMVSTNGSPVHRDFAFAVGVESFLVKPFFPFELLNAIDGLLPLRSVSSSRPPSPVAVASD